MSPEEADFLGTEALIAMLLNVNEVELRVIIGLLNKQAVWLLLDGDVEGQEFLTGLARRLADELESEK